MPDAIGPGDGRILMLNKPKGCVVTRSDERGRKTVYDILPAWVRERNWVPVGRLDRDSRGLLLMTIDGALVELLTRPGACVKKYEVWIRGRVTGDHIAAMRSGVTTPAGVLKAVRVEQAGGAGPKTRLVVELDEGRNRHIRRMFGALHDPEHGTPLKVLELKRTDVGPLHLDIESGSWRMLTPEEETRLTDDART